MSEQEQDGVDPPEAVVVQRLDGFPALLRRLGDGSFVLEGRDGEQLPELRPGERLRVTRPVPGDATYVQSARVLGADAEHPGAVDIRAAEEPRREQQRRFVRVSTAAIEVVLASADGERLTGELRDVSAGGVRTVLGEDELPVGARLRLELSLPRQRRADLDVALDGEVVWTGALDDGRRTAGIEFAGVDETLQANITNWVYRQQSKRR